MGQMPNQRRKLLTATLAATGLGIAHAPNVLAQTYPSKAITFVVPYPPGGANDMLGRLLGQKMGEILGGTVLVENKPGAAALIGGNVVAKAVPDGHTVLVGGLATHAASPHLLKADYNPIKDFESIGMIGMAPIVAITFVDSPIKSLADVVESAKKNPNGVMYGSSGNGSPLHLAGEIFDANAKTKMTHVPYKGGNAHIVDLIGGRLNVIFDTTTNAMPLIKTGKVRALAIGLSSRHPDLPNVPTFAEAGFSDFQFSAWYALFAPAGTPKDVVAKLSNALARTLKMPDVNERLKGVGLTLASGDAAELAKFVPGEYDRLGALIRSAGIKAD
jgi:tripartite-type tricarboxylate transporter receptor subunit TctC